LAQATDLRLADREEPRGPSALMLQLQAPSLWGYVFSASEVRRGGLTVVDSRVATGLDFAVAGSDRAVALALDARHDLVRGNALYFTGTGVIALSLFAELAGDLVWASNQPATSAATLPVALPLACAAGVLAGAIATLVGVHFLSSGLHSEYDAVNAYNADLVDGRLNRLPPP
jgi:hypothetical protein